MIRTFADTATEDAFNGVANRRVPANVRRAARRKLQMVNAAVTLYLLRFPPGNRLEALRGNRVGQFSIRVNQQWRICFRWEEGDAYDVEFCDYH